MKPSTIVRLRRRVQLINEQCCSGYGLLDVYGVL